MPWRGSFRFGESLTVKHNKKALKRQNEPFVTLYPLLRNIEPRAILGAFAQAEAT